LEMRCRGAWMPHPRKDQESGRERAGYRRGRERAVQWIRQHA
jgi:hypothetical protein